eukprot:2106738-Prymnesium_polylepis.1
MFRKHCETASIALRRFSRSAIKCARIRAAGFSSTASGAIVPLRAERISVSAFAISVGATLSACRAVSSARSSSGIVDRLRISSFRRSSSVRADDTHAVRLLVCARERAADDEHLHRTGTLPRCGVHPDLFGGPGGHPDFF